MTAALHIFCGYSHDDEALFQQLKKTLVIPIKQEAISIWYDRELLPGSEWDAEIERQLNSADIILLLVSPSFMASEYCWSKEMRWAISRHDTGDAYLVPIIAEPTPGWETTPLGTLLALPTDAKPITNWSNRKRAFENVAVQLLRLIRQIQLEEKYPVQEYEIWLESLVCENGEGKYSARGQFIRPRTLYFGGMFLRSLIEPDSSKYLAMQWNQKVLGKIPGTLQEISETQYRYIWMFASNQQKCFISHPKAFYHPVFDELGRCFQLKPISLRCQHPALLDRIIREGRLSYYALEWKLADLDLDLPSIARKISEQTWRELPRRMREGKSFHSISYDLSDKNLHIHPVYVTLQAKDRSSPASVSLTYDHYPPGKDEEVPRLEAFYRAHTLFSIRKIFKALYGEISRQSIQRFIEEACRP